MKKVTDNVFVEDRYSAHPYNRGCNPGFVVTSEGIVLIDTPMIPRYTIQWREELARLGQVRYIINTHFHADHTAGNFLFDVPIIAHEGDWGLTQKLLHGIFIPAVAKRSQGKPLTLEKTTQYDIEDRDPESIPLMQDFHLREPTITFKKRLTLHVGDHTFICSHLPGHVPNHIGVYVPEEKVFFTGDNFTNRVQPVLSSSMPADWIESLKYIEATDSEAFIPGHGAVGGKKEVQEFRQFIEKCLETVQEAINKGLSKEEAASQISFENIYPAIHPGPQQQRLNVSRLYETLLNPE